jgi:hypothetical protein
MSCLAGLAAEAVRLSVNIAKDIIVDFFIFIMMLSSLFFIL